MYHSLDSSPLPIFQMGKAEKRLKAWLEVELVRRGRECEHRQSGCVVQAANLSTSYLSIARQGQGAGRYVVVTVRMVTIVICLWCHGRKEKPPESHILSGGAP